LRRYVVRQCGGTGESRLYRPGAARESRGENRESLRHAGDSRTSSLLVDAYGCWLSSQSHAFELLQLTYTPKYSRIANKRCPFMTLLRCSVCLYDRSVLQYTYFSQRRLPRPIIECGPVDAVSRQRRIVVVVVAVSPNTNPGVRGGTVPPNIRRHRRRPRSIQKHVSQVTVAAGAVTFQPRQIALVRHGVRNGRAPKGRPCAGIVFGSVAPQ
jgi:hypothetical protein